MAKDLSKKIDDYLKRSEKVAKELNLKSFDAFRDSLRGYMNDLNNKKNKGVKNENN